LVGVIRSSGDTRPRHPSRSNGNRIGRVAPVPLPQRQAGRAQFGFIGGIRISHSPKSPNVTSHSFRKTVATLIDDEGLSARIGADHLGHANVSMTQDRYMSRGRVHVQVSELLDRAVTVINDE
jgi:integrase